MGRSPASGYAQQAGSGLAEAGGDAFDRSRQLFEKVVAELADPGCGELTHAQLEDQLTERSRELMRSLFQDHIVAEFPETLPTHIRTSLGVERENRRFDTVIMGRATYDPTLAEGSPARTPT